MVIINSDELSLLAFSSESIVREWRNDYIAKQKNIDQTLISTHHTNTAHQDSYTKTAAVNKYTKAAHTDQYTPASYSNVAHTNKYTQTAEMDLYAKLRSPYYTDKYVDCLTYVVSAATTSGNVGSYTKSGQHSQYAKNTSLLNKVDTYDAYNKYTKAPSYSFYTKIPAEDTKVAAKYTKVAAKNTYSKTAAADLYTEKAAENKGIDHENYVPSKPGVYDLEGQVIVQKLDLSIATFDKNQAGSGSKDQASTTVYYDIALRRVETLSGSKVSESWKNLKTHSTNNDFNFDVSKYASGVYEVRVIAYNEIVIDGKTRKDSSEKIYTFTINNTKPGSTLTVINSKEFADYIFGTDTFTNNSGEIEAYAHRSIYKNAASDKQKGLYVELSLKDEDTNTYHVAKAKLVEGKKAITSSYNVTFTKGNTTGNKTGYVFIPLNDMLDDGAFDKVKIELSVTEYNDAGHSSKKGESYTTYGLTDAKKVIYIGVDGEPPQIEITEKQDQEAIENSLTLSFIDRGLGISSAFYQVVAHGESVKENAWAIVEGASHELMITNPGLYDIYAKAIDKAGNEHVEVKESYYVGQLDMWILSKNSVTRGEILEVGGIIASDKKALSARFKFSEIQDYVDGTKIKQRKLTKETYEDIFGTKFIVPESAKKGAYVLYFEVTLEDGEKRIISKLVDVVDNHEYEYGPLIVTHKEKWLKNLDDFNRKKLGDEKREESNFWLGEGFVCGIDINFKDKDAITDKALVKRVAIVEKEGSSNELFSCDLSEYVESGQYLKDVYMNEDGSYTLKERGTIWEKNMYNYWQNSNTKTLFFKFEFMDGRIEYAERTLNNNSQYYQLIKKF